MVGVVCRNFMRLVCMLYLLFNAGNVQAQTYDDTLQQKLQHAHDTLKIRLLKRASTHYEIINPDRAIVLANEIVEIAKLNGDTINQLEGMVLLARAHQNRSEFYQSAQYFYQVIAKSEKWVDTKKLASYHNSLGINLFYLKDFDKAVFHIQKAADLKLKTNEIDQYATIIGNLAMVLHRLNRNKEAIKSLNYAEDVLKKNGNNQHLGNLYNVYGSIYQMGYKKLDSAEFFYRKSLAIVSKNGDGLMELTALANIGMVCSEQDKFDEAQHYLEKALILSKKLKREIATLSIYESLSNLYAKKSNYKLAFDYRTLQFDLKDSIFNSDKEKVVANLEAQYQNEKGKQVIQAQKLELEKSRNKTLWSAIIAILLVFLVLTLLVYFKFQSRLQKQLEKAKETFFSNVVHEIRSPITMIQAPLKLLQNKITDTEALVQLNLAEKSLKRLNELLNQMLMISKIDTGKITINESYGNFLEFIEPIVEQYKAQAKLKEQSLLFNNALKETHFSFDADAIQKIIENLLSNAVKYTHVKGEIGIDIFSAADNLTIVVWDNGAGIEKKDIEKVFERFYRTKESLNNKVTGIGIGLSLVKSLAEAMKGTIDLQSSKGEGSVFTVQIPVKNGRVYNHALTENEYCILLVEDDEDILMFNKQFLEQNNYKVITATNGIEAVQILKTQIPDLIISDLMMPGMNGFEFIKEIRHNINTEHIPVLVLSAKSSPQSRMEVLKSGAQAYLAKPFMPEEFLHLVNSQVLMLKQRSREFKENVEVAVTKAEEKYKGNDPYTEKFFKIIFENLDNSDFSVEQFADLMATNRSHFQRKIKALTSYSPSELIKLVRLEKSKELLRDKKGNITEVAYMCGFSSQSYFTKSFTQQFAISPSQFIADSSKKQHNLY